MNKCLTSLIARAIIKTSSEIPIKNFLTLGGGSTPPSYYPLLYKKAGILSIQKNTSLTSSESYIIHLLSGSLKKEADETLFLELARRGYDLSKPLRADDEVPTETARESHPTQSLCGVLSPEIVKIG